jgi:hypothetical protein
MSNSGANFESLIPTEIANGKTNIDVRAYGAVAGTDCSAAILSAIKAAEESGLKAFSLYFAANKVSYMMALGILGEAGSGKGISIKLSGDGLRASKIAPINASESILTIEGPSDETNQGFSIVDLGIEIPEHRRYDKPLFQINLARSYHLERVLLDGGNHTGTFFSHESSYAGSWRDVQTQRGAYCLPFIHTNTVKPLQQCDNFVFDRCDFRVNGPIFRNASDEVHSVVMVTPKAVQTGEYPEGSKLLTTLSSEASAGATSLHLTSVTGLKVGDLLRVGHDANGNSSDYCRVTEIIGTEVKVAAETPLLFTHATAAAVQQGGIPLTLGDGVHACTIIRPHFERHMAGVALGNTADVEIFGYYGTVAYGVLVCGPTMQKVKISGAAMGGTTVANEMFHTSSDNPASGLGEYIFEGPLYTITGATFTATANAPSSVKYKTDILDTSLSTNTRKNVGGSSAYKDRAWEITSANVTKFKVQYSGRGFFNDGMCLGDLGSITGKTSAEIDTLVEERGIAPGDATTLGILHYTGEREGARVLLARKAGAGNKWRYVAMTEIS